jgi:hypothetical protein
MSKRLARPRKRSGTKQKKRSRQKLLVIVCLLLSSAFAVGGMAWWRVLPGMTKPAMMAPPSNFNANSPSKEYIYAGGRLIATEEAVGPSGPAPTAPTAVAATALSPTSVTITWAMATDPTVDHYEVERAENYQGPYVAVTPNPGAQATSITDTGREESKAYLYRVRAFNASGQSSDYRIDLATTIIFTDSLTNTTFIRAQHLVELRRAVNAVRHLAGQGDATWTYPDPVSTPVEQRRKIFFEDVTDLRTNLEIALQVLGLSQPYPPSPALERGGLVFKEHFQQIRDRIQ